MIKLITHIEMLREINEFRKINSPPPLPALRFAGEFLKLIARTDDQYSLA